MSIKTSFTIKDLENLSGIKAHTIRIWEKRYNLLQPERTDSNIRTYNVENLKKILSIALINNQGIKVSKIACLDSEGIYNKVAELTNEKDSFEPFIIEFKLAMLNFDTILFNTTYSKLLERYTVKEIFCFVFTPLLKNIGHLWMTNTITPAHERFISNLLRQKLLIAIDQLPQKSSKDQKVFALYLPLNELHDLGLLYIHYELLAKGHKSIYLGSSVPIDNLQEIQKIFDHATFVSYFTVKPDCQNITGYFEKISQEILSTRNEKLHVIGRQTIDCIDPVGDNIIIHDDIFKMLDHW